jgi:hypothetical protein
MLSLMYGPRVTQRWGRGSLYGHLLFGAAYGSATVSPGPHAKEWTFAVAPGVGLDVSLGNRAAVRVLQIQYSPMNPIVAEDHKFQASAGFVWYVGRKRL